MAYTLQNRSKPTIHIHAEQALIYERQDDRWAIYKVKPKSGVGFLFTVIEVCSTEKLKPKDYRDYRKVISGPINGKELIKLIGIKESQCRDILNELGIDWEDETAIVYGGYSE